MVEVCSVQGEQERGQDCSLCGPCTADNCVRHTVSGKNSLKRNQSGGPNDTVMLQVRLKLTSSITLAAIPVVCFRDVQYRTKSG